MTSIFSCFIITFFTCLSWRLWMHCLYFPQALISLIDLHGDSVKMLCHNLMHQRISCLS